MIYQKPSVEIYDQILVIIVLYKIKLEESLTFMSLSNRIDKMNFFIYDNSPNKEQVGTYTNRNFHFFYDSSNPGIGKAYNQGASFAKKLNKKWLLFCDQDSFFPENYFSTLLKAIKDNPNQILFVPKLIANNKIISPCNFFLGRGFSLNNINIGINSLVGKSLLNSGLFIERKIFEELGGYDEKIKLDFSDHAFIKKFKRNHKTFFLLPVEIEHSFSGFVNTKDQSLIRYKYYCNGAFSYANSIGMKIIIMIWLFLRGVKLSYTFKDFEFLLCFFKYL